MQPPEPDPIAQPLPVAGPAAVDPAQPVPDNGRPAGRRRGWLIAGVIAALLAAAGGGYAVGLAVGHSGHTTPVATSGSLGSNTGSLGTPSKPFSGDVTAVNGSTLTLTDTLSGATVTVELTSRTTVRLVNYGSELDIKPGSTVTVQGPRISGNVFRARVVTIDSGPTP